MALWSGTTLYERHLNAKRELWIPKGFTKDDLLYCWKVKFDLATGKHFFVNLAGFGKSWRLPDIYDARVQEDMRRFAESIGSSATAVTNDQLAACDTPPPVPASARPSSSAARREEGAPSQAPRSDKHSAGPGDSRRESFRSSEGMVSTAKSSATLQRHTPPPEVVANSFRYDDDAWGGTSGAEAESPSSPPPPSAATALALRESDEARRRERELERDLMARGVRQPNLFDPLAGTGMASELLPTRPAGPAPALTSAKTLDVVEQLFERSSQLEASYAHHVTTQQQRLESLSRSHVALETERQLKDALYVKEVAELARLEQEQAARIAHDAEEVRRRLSQSPPRSSSPAFSRDPPLRDSGGSSGVSFPTQRPASAGERASRAVVAALPPAASSSASLVEGPSFVDDRGSRALLLAMEQLDHERVLNVKLAQQLEERDRLLMQHLIADAERERREIALRIRMVEAMAAYRREHELEQQLLDEEQEADALQRQLSSSPTWASRYIPRHPLLDAD